MKTQLALVFAFCLPVSVSAMDVSPFKVGDKVTAEQARALQDRAAKRPVQDWFVQTEKIESQPNAKSIQYGIQLLSNTAKTIGPKVANPSLRYSGNSLSCTNCHLKGPDGLPGTAPFALPLVNVMNDYPSFRNRDMNIGDAADRVNGCMQRSQGAGKKLPKDSKEMTAILDYFKYLAKGTKSGQAMKYTGLPAIKFPNRRADLVNGKDLYIKECLSCHGVDGKGMPSPTYAKDGTYLFPPLAGNDSFNNGAGMSRLKKATRFIYANMPLGTTHTSPVLSVEEAYDIAGYMESLARPTKAHREKDFPNPDFRPADYAVPDYFKGDEAALEKAKYGPYTK